MRRSRALILGLVVLYVGAVSLRLLPTLETGLLYTYDSWEDAGRVRPALNSGFYPRILPHGPLFYVLMLQWCLVSGMGVFGAFMWFIPFLSSLLVLPTFLLTRRLIGDDRASLYASLFASNASFLLHWTATPVPESVGLVYVILIIYLLYCAIDGQSCRHLLMLGISYVAIVLTHHLTPFLFLTGLSILGVDAFMSKKKGWRRLPLYLTLLFVPSTFLWWDWAIADWTIGVIGRILSVASPLLVFGVFMAVLSFFALSNLVEREEYFPRSKGRELRVAGSIAGVTAVLMLTTFAILVTQTNFSLPLGYLFVYGGTHMPLIYFPAWLGFILFFNRNREHWKRMFSLSWCLGTYCVDVLLAFASFYFVISYRTFSFLILVGLPLLGYGYSYLSGLGHPRWRLVQGVTIAYLAVLLVPLGFPSARLAFGSDEFYRRSEYCAAAWAGGHIVGQTVFDSDHRMGKLLRYVTGHFAWLGNESSWIGDVTQTGEIVEIAPSLEYLVVTATMIEYLVTDGVERQGKPVTPRIISYLHSAPYVNLIYSSDHVIIYRNGHYYPSMA